MSYTYITSRNAAPENYSTGRNGHSPAAIVIHWWNTPEAGATFEGVISAFENPRRRASAHYVVEAGRVACLVDPENTAWHAGNWAINLTSIGFECNPRASDADLATIAELIAELRAVYGDLPLSPHNQWSPTQCPGVYLGLLDKLDTLANNVSPVGAPTKTVTPPAKKNPVSVDIDTLARSVIAGNYGNGQARKKALGTHYDAVQARVNQILAGGVYTAPYFDLEKAARAVIAGKYGNGEARKKALGTHYDAVQAIVNKKLLGA